MKNIFTAIVVLVSMALSASALADKNGIYVSGKMGSSIVDMTGQKYVYSQYPDAEDNGSKNGGSHHNGVFGGGVAVGYDFSNEFNLPIRAELDFTARGKVDSSYNVQNRVRNGVTQTRDIKNQVKLNTLMVNAYYDFKNESKFTPFASVGLGYAAVDMKTTRVDGRNPGVGESATHSHTSNNFAWSVGAGVNYAINEDFDIGLSYRYLDAGKAEISSARGEGVTTSKLKVKSNDIMLGVAYRF